MRLVTFLDWGCIQHTGGEDALEVTYLWRELCLKVIEIARQSQVTGFYLKCHQLELRTHREYCYTMDNLRSFALVYPIQLPTFPLKPAIYVEASSYTSTADWKFGIDKREEEGITYEQGSIPDTILVSDSVVRSWIEPKFHESVMAACSTVPEFALWPPGLLPIVVSFTSYLRHISL